MTGSVQLSPKLSAREILDLYYLENRARLLEIAAFLDRIDRAPDCEAGKVDSRYRALMEAIDALRTVDDRTKAIQKCFSDPTTEPIASAAGLKGAVGAWGGKE